MRTPDLKIGAPSDLMNPAFAVGTAHVGDGEITQALSRARLQTDTLFALLDPAAIYDRPVPARHRMIFYLGHLEAFDFNLLGARERSLPPLHPSFDRLFSFGIDPDSASLPADRPSDWPAYGDVVDYVAAVRARVDELAPQASPDALRMCVEHRLMHAETLCYLLHSLPYNVKRQPRPVSIAPAPRLPRRMISIPEGSATLGKMRDGSFGWDNEFLEHVQLCPAFAIASHKVTNGDYLQFVEAGGPPSHFWTRRDGRWFYRGMFEVVELPLDAPVYVTHAQASAYAAWRGWRLPSEAQYHRAAYGTPGAGERLQPWGDSAPHPRFGNFGFQTWDPVDVDAFPDGTSAFGLAQTVGNGWEWTRDVFAPFAGFEAHPWYPGYSADFFDGHHYVLKGASPRTAPELVRRSFRNWFRPDYPYVYATFRCVED